MRYLLILVASALGVTGVAVAQTDTAPGPQVAVPTVQAAAAPAVAPTVPPTVPPVAAVVEQNTEAVAVTPPPPAAAQAPAEEQPLVWPLPQAPHPEPGDPVFTVCEIVTGGAFGKTFVGVYGATSHPRGTVFTVHIDVDDQHLAIPMVARPGSIVVRGVLYGHEDGYVDDGTNTNFGLNSTNMPGFLEPHGPITAWVELNGTAICTL